MPLKTLEGRSKGATAKATSTPKQPLKPFSEAERVMLQDWAVFRITSLGLDPAVWESNMILQLLSILRNEVELERHEWRD